MELPMQTRICQAATFCASSAAQVIERANNNCYGLASGIIRWAS